MLYIKPYGHMVMPKAGALEQCIFTVDMANSDKQNHLSSLAGLIYCMVFKGNKIVISNSRMIWNPLRSFMPH